MSLEQTLLDGIAQANSRFDLWSRFIQACNTKQMAEVGVYKGDFAFNILEKCDSVEKYYMIDPWRHLDDWNKPANQNDRIFEEVYSEAIKRTEFAAGKRIVLRGKTTEVIDSIPDNTLDFSYIDGDHTLKGITTDLICLYPKIRMGGWIGGDDFSKTIWQHRTDFEPTLVFPFAIYFAEAVGDCIYALPFEQFLIEKQASQSFSFIDLTGQYENIGLRDQFHPNKVLKLKIRETLHFPVQIVKRMKNLVAK